MTTQRRKACIRLVEDELELMLTLIESTIGGPAWRHNEREGYRLLEKIEECERRFVEGFADGNDNQSPA